MIKVILNRQTLEKALTRRNLSRKVFAAEIGMSRSHLARVDLGQD